MTVQYIACCTHCLTDIKVILSSRKSHSKLDMELIKGKTLIKADGSSHQADAVLSGKKVVLIYFSAHWCPPCRGFTPVLKDFYEVMKNSWYFSLFNHTANIKISLTGSQGSGRGTHLRFKWQVFSRYVELHEGIPRRLVWSSTWRCLDQWIGTKVWREWNPVSGCPQSWWKSNHKGRKIGRCQQRPTGRQGLVVKKGRSTICVWQCDIWSWLILFDKNLQVFAILHINCLCKIMNDNEWKYNTILTWFHQNTEPFIRLKNKFFQIFKFKVAIDRSTYLCRQEDFNSMSFIRGDLFTQPKSEASLAFCVRKGLPQNEEGYCQNFQTKVWPSFRISQS